MSKKYLTVSVICIIVLVVVAGVFMRGRNTPHVSFVGAPLPPGKVVTLRDDGFDPPKLTISVGTSVRWINVASAPVASINSDNFPTNRLYPDLNLGNFKNQQSLTHIFTKAGTYTYHDQYHPERKGTVEVK